MIASGEKKEEYRDFKPYYHKRLYHPYEYVKLYLGYTKRHMLFRCIKIDVGFGKEEWGAEKDKLYYAMRLLYIFTKYLSNVFRGLTKILLS